MKNNGLFTNDGVRSIMGSSSAKANQHRKRASKERQNLDNISNHYQLFYLVIWLGKVNEVENTPTRLFAYNTG